MRIRVCYLASKAPIDELASTFRLVLSRPQAKMPVGQWWVTSIEQSGWTILWSEDENFCQRSIQNVAKLSQKYETYICEINEVVMWSAAEYWRGGRQIWNVTHAGDCDDILNLMEVGVFPKNFSLLKEKYYFAQKNQSDDIDYIFKVPLELVALNTGFKYEYNMRKRDFGTFHTIILPPKRLLSCIFGR